jgi:dTDP-4-dehydrorhamnose reductase
MTVNADGTEWVARAARETGARMVHVSTDYVFDGEKTTPYIEEDRARPLSRYGLSKLEGERRVAEICPESNLIVRTGWLYGAGKGYVDWVLGRLDEGALLRLVDDQVGSPTWAAEVASALLILAEQGHTGTFHFVNKGETHWLGAARAIVDCLGLETARLERSSLADWDRPAARPRYSALDVSKFEEKTGAGVTPWNQALADYLASVGRLPDRRAAQSG